MLKRFLPQQEGFFTLFQQSAEKLNLAATQFHLMLLDLTDQQQFVNAIAAYEEEGDTIAHATFELLHKSFITPFDRNDIHQLTSQLDDILDLINRCAQRFPFYQLTEVPIELVQLAELGVQCTQFLKQAIGMLHSLAQSSDILKFCEEIDELESRAHKIYLAGEKDLFLTENEFKHFFKLKEIYSQTKNVTSSCQDAANIIKGIVLEYS